MTEWFECKVTYEGENGKKISEHYLVDAVNFTEAESILTEEISAVITGEFKIETVKREKIYEMFRSETADIWFKVKVEFIVVDDKGKEKRIKSVMYLQSEKIDDVVKDMIENMRGTMSDYEIVNIASTKILDVFERKD